jgi:hypothetical protein
MLRIAALGALLLTPCHILSWPNVGPKTNMATTNADTSVVDDCGFVQSSCVIWQRVASR